MNNPKSHYFLQSDWFSVIISRVKYFRDSLTKNLALFWKYQAPKVIKNTEFFLTASNRQKYSQTNKQTKLQQHNNNKTPYILSIFLFHCWVRKYKSYHMFLYLIFTREYNEHAKPQFLTYFALWYIFPLKEMIKMFSKILSFTENDEHNRSYFKCFAWSELKFNRFRKEKLFCQLIELKPRTFDNV